MDRHEIIGKMKAQAFLEDFKARVALEQIVAAAAPEATPVPPKSPEDELYDAYITLWTADLEPINKEILDGVIDQAPGGLVLTAAARRPRLKKVTKAERDRMLREITKKVTGSSGGLEGIFARQQVEAMVAVDRARGYDWFDELVDYESKAWKAFDNEQDSYMVRSLLKAPEGFHPRSAYGDDIITLYSRATGVPEYKVQEDYVSGRLKLDPKQVVEKYLTYTENKLVGSPKLLEAQRKLNNFIKENPFEPYPQDLAKDVLSEFGKRVAKDPTIISRYVAPADTKEVAVRAIAQSKRFTEAQNRVLKDYDSFLEAGMDPEAARRKAYGMVPTQDAIDQYPLERRRYNDMLRKAAARGETLSFDTAYRLDAINESFAQESATFGGAAFASANFEEEYGAASTKQWITVRDNNVRRTHLGVDYDVKFVKEDSYLIGQYERQYDDGDITTFISPYPSWTEFDVGKRTMSGPGDPRGDFEETARCRCRLHFDYIWIDPDDPEDDEDYIPGPTSDRYLESAYAAFERRMKQQQIDPLEFDEDAKKRIAKYAEQKAAGLGDPVDPIPEPREWRKKQTN